MTPLILSSLLFAAPPATAEAAAAVPAKPPARLLRRSLPGGLAAVIRIQPGVPEVAKVTRVVIEISRKGPAGPVPLNGANLTALIEPNTNMGRKRFSAPLYFFCSRNSTAILVQHIAMLIHSHFVPDNMPAHAKLAITQ